MIYRITIIVILLLGLCNRSYAEDIYLARTLGDGSDGNPFRSGCAPGASSIDLRSTLGKDVWICRSADMVGATGAIAISKGMKTQMTGPVRAAVITAVGKGLKAGTLTPTDLLSELLINSGKITSGLDGKLKIYLGDPTPVYEQTAWVPFHDYGIFADAANTISHWVEPAVAWATNLLTETFPGSNGDLDGVTYVHPWSEFGITGWSVVSNQVTTSTTTTGANNGRLGDTLATANHQVDALLVNVVNTGGGFARCGVLARKDNTTTQTYYTFFADSSVTGFELSKRIANVTTSLNINTQDPVNGTDVISLIVDGSTITGLVNGIAVSGPTTDVDITGNTYVGIYGHASTTTFTCTLDNIVGRDYPIVSLPGVIRRRHF